MWKLKDEFVKKEDLAKSDKTAEEYRKEAEIHQEAARSMRKTFLETGIFLAIAMIGIIVIAVAWFVTNNRVGAESSNVAVNNDELFLIASAGERQKVEIDKYKENCQSILTDTDGETYYAYYDTLTGKKVNLTAENPLILYTGTAWHLKDNNGSMYPGSRDILEFYVIPQVDSLSELKFSLDILGYKETTDQDKPVIQVTDNNLNDLLKGHILFFKNLDDDSGYSGWLNADKKEISIKIDGHFEKNLPYKISIYWVWPRRYRNFIYHQKSTHGDLFTDEESNDYKTLISFINENKKMFFYNNGETMEKVDTGINMSDEQYARGTSYYNIADEYIGKNMDYIYLEIKPW